MGYQSHHPPHLFEDNTWYMFSASTFNHLMLFNMPGRKDDFLVWMKSAAEEYEIQLFSWVILNDHYHLIANVKEGATLPNFFRQIHGRSAFEFNKEDDVKGRQVWHNYWDTSIRSEEDFWTRFNYIHHNPVKHGYVQNLGGWEYSSYTFWVERRGQGWMDNVLKDYPIIDFSDPND